MNRLVAALIVILGAAPPAAAQQLRLEIQDGKVTLDATAVPARQILAEWARIGATKVVGSEKIAGAPLTLKLVNMPERQALDIILRNVAGFMAAPRLASSVPGASSYDRILIMATTSAVAPPTATGGRSTGNTAVGQPSPRRVPPRPPSLQPSPADTAQDEDQQMTATEDTADTGTQPVFTFPAQPGAPAVPPGNQIFVPMQQNMPIFGRPGGPGNTAPPVITLQPNPNGQPTIYNFVPNVEGGGQTPPNPPGFTVIGSPRPGMIPPPPAPQPGQQPQRPPPQNQRQ